MPAALMRLFSTQDTPLANNDEREQELKKTLGILGKPSLSVSELEKQLLQPPLPVETTTPMPTPHLVSTAGLTASNATNVRLTGFSRGIHFHQVDRQKTACAHKYVSILG
jgi:hypothetical protein